MTASQLARHTHPAAAARRLPLLPTPPPSPPSFQSLPLAPDTLLLVADEQQENLPPPAYSCRPTYVTCAGTTWVSTPSNPQGADRYSGINDGSLESCTRPPRHNTTSSTTSSHLRTRRRRRRPIVIETRCLEDEEIDPIEQQQATDAQHHSIASMGKLVATDDKELRTSYGRGGAGNLRRVSEAQHAHQVFFARRTNAAAEAELASQHDHDTSSAASSLPRRSSSVVSLSSWVDSLKRKVSKKHAHAQDASAPTRPRSDSEASGSSDGMASGLELKRKQKQPAPAHHDHDDDHVGPLTGPSCLTSDSSAASTAASEPAE